MEVKTPICKRGSDRQNHEKMGQEDLLARSRILDLGDGTERTYDKGSCVKSSGSFAGINHTVETWLVCTQTLQWEAKSDRRSQTTSRVSDTKQRTVTLIHSPTQTASPSHSASEHSQLRSPKNLFLNLPHKAEVSTKRKP